MPTCIIGAGYVGLTYAAGLTLKGTEVILVDVNPDVVKQVNRGECPIDEPNIPDAIRNAVDTGLLVATNDLLAAYEKSNPFLICVGTYCNEKGFIDLCHVRSVARNLKDCLVACNTGEFKVFCIKSTVICGTTDGVVLPMLEESNKIPGKDFGIAMSPEFLREGSALDDIMHPDKIVIGGYDDRSRRIVRQVLGIFAIGGPEPDQQCPIIETDLRTAEMIKYAQNAFLATKISFINEMSNFAELFGVNIDHVAHAIGLDKRISPHFLKAGPGFGGSCFPKDVRAIYTAGRQMGFSPLLLEAVLEVNHQQKRHVVELMQWHGDVTETTVAILGLAFKPGTGDTRESIARHVLHRLEHLGVKRVQLHDPSTHAREEFEQDYPRNEKRHYHETIQGALEGAGACLILTDWKEYRDLGPTNFSAMVENPLIIDSRRILNKENFVNTGITLIRMGESSSTKFVPC